VNLMSENKELYILWTNADQITSEKMVMMYGINSKINNWWKEVTIIIWGATAKLTAENGLIQEKIKQAIHVGVNVSACKACAEQLGVSDKLVELGIEVKYWGEQLTEVLKENEKLLTI
jgi:hypothetical protein